MSGPREPDDPTWGRPPAGDWGPEPMYPGPERGDYDRRDDDRDYDRRDYDRGDYGRGAPASYGSEPEYGWQQPGPDDRYGAGDPYPPEQPPYQPYRPYPGQGHPATSRRAARVRRRPPWIPLAVAGAVVAVLLVLGFVAPGWLVTRVFDAAAVQTGVAKVLSDDYGAEGVADVHCPDGVKVAAGASFTCDATIDGDPVKIPVRVTDGKGGYEVGRPA